MKTALTGFLAGILTVGVAVLAPGAANAADPPIGTAWAGVQEGANKRVNAIATNGTGTWVATTRLGYPGTIQRSTNNGVTWNAAATQPPVVAPAEFLAFVDVAWCSDRFIAVGTALTATDDRSLVAYSTNGDSWTTVLPTGLAQEVRPHAVDCNGSNVVAVGESISGSDQTLMTSADGGVTWTGRADFSGSQGAAWLGVTYDSDVGFVAVRNSAGSDDVMISTDNGVNWTGVSSGLDSAWTAITDDGTTLVAVAESGTNRVMTSTNGQDWIGRTAAAEVNWNDVAAGAGTFVAVASGSTAANGIMTSTDSGASWTSQPAPAQNNWDTIAYGGSPSRFVAGGVTFTSVPAQVNFMYTTPTPVPVLSVGETSLSWSSPLWTGASSGLTTYTVLYKRTSDANNPAVKWGVYAQRTTGWPGGVLPNSVELDATPGNCGATNAADGWENCPMPRGPLVDGVSYTFRVFARTETTLGLMSAPATYTPGV